MSRYIVALNLFKHRWWYARGLFVDSVTYAHYMIELMLHPDKRDWQIFLSDYNIVFAIAWLHAAYNEFCLNRLSTALSDAI